MSLASGQIYLEIKEGDLLSAVGVSDKIPEFDAPYSIRAYQKRLEGTRQLVLTAFGDDGAIGFKIGYDRFSDGSFYSWMGGVLLEYRRKGVAERLANYQEKWAKKVGYKSIRLKTRKKHQYMIIFSEQREFVVREVVPKFPVQETRIWMEKTL